ncbi:Serine/threonine protein kinase [Trichlorobacter thiogenes]|uniref:Serine/threonine protein kinase n=1 Tax=Trichlorobacter thiogenes TaxID=115783 RepID=A0A1T4NY23_9BACT|nr:serine/threonine-protein kinase [Trichlorobacter thiogenes]SJZ84143.1 Serine/threonine protein kinase [Trichlorobacter thiogenes]
MATISSIDLLSYVGTTIGTVTLVKLLGQGSMGAVFIGYQTTLKRQVAVKILPKSLASSPNAQKMFRDEAETIGILNHPNIVPVYEMGETSDFFFQIMQLIAGSDLRSIIVKARKHPVPTKRILPFSETIHYICQVLDALDYAHDEGVVHQDIKPANILIDDRFKRPIVADFGIARTIWAEYSASSSLFGTPLYISPEQAARTETDGRTDMYSVGVILMEMVAGLLPVRSESPVDMIQRKKTDPDSFFTARPSEVNPAVDRELESIIATATASQPGNRFADCLEFKVELETYIRTRSLN